MVSAVAAFCRFAPAARAQADYRIGAFTLASGMIAVVLPDHRAPVVTYRCACSIDGRRVRPSNAHLDILAEARTRFGRRAWSSSPGSGVLVRRQADRELVPRRETAYR